MCYLNVVVSNRMWQPNIVPNVLGAKPGSFPRRVAVGAALNGGIYVHAAMIW